MNNAHSRRVAAIGVGSNSVRLLIAEGSGGRLSALERLETVTRLASFREASGGAPYLSDESIGKTWATVNNFAQHAWECDATLLGVIATESVRAAANRSSLIDPLERDLGIPVTVISSEEEAMLGWQAIASSYETSAHLGVIDIGGASSDLSVGRADSPEPQDVTSVKLGSRTLMRQFNLDQPTQPSQLAGV